MIRSSLLAHLNRRRQSDDCVPAKDILTNFITGSRPRDLVLSDYIMHEGVRFQVVKST